MKAKLTDRLIRSHSSMGCETLKIWDIEVPGFMCRITRGGSKSFVFDYRIGRRRRQLTIGSFPSWSTAVARQRAQALRVSVDDGRDPAAERNESRKAPMMSDLWVRMEETYRSKSKRTHADRRQMWEKQILPAMRGMRVDAVSVVDVEALHAAKTSAGHPYAANRLIEVLRHAFNKAVQWQLRADNPVVGVEKNPERPRERYLGREEYHRLLSALDTVPNQVSADAIRLLAFTGARMGEVLNARWDQFDLQDSIWVKPAATTKQKRTHRVPLNGLALGVLSRMATNRQGDLLFPGPSAGKAQSQFRKTFAHACKLAEIENFRVHDLRHSFASVLISNGVELAGVGAMLGHTQAQTTQRYAHLHDEPLRDATSRMDRFLDRPSVAAE